MTGFPNGYWPNVRALASLVERHGERMERAARNAYDIAVLGPNATDAGQAQLDHAIATMEREAQAVLRIVPNLRELTEAARSVSSDEADG